MEDDRDEIWVAAAATAAGRPLVPNSSHVPGVWKHAVLLARAAAEGVEGCSAPVYLCKTEHFWISNQPNLVRKSVFGEWEGFGGWITGGKRE